jgi:hypothetical protein
MKSHHNSSVVITSIKKQQSLKAIINIHNNPLENITVTSLSKTQSGLFDVGIEVKLGDHGQILDGYDEAYDTANFPVTNEEMIANCNEHMIQWGIKILKDNNIVGVIEHECHTKIDQYGTAIVCVNSKF